MRARLGFKGIYPVLSITVFTRGSAGVYGIMGGRRGWIATLIVVVVVVVVVVVAVAVVVCHYFSVNVTSYGG